MKRLDDISSAINQVTEWLGGDRPQVAIVLGSGWSGLLSHLEQSKSLEYEELNSFPPSGVLGHCGKLHFGSLFDIPVLIFQGRYHFYEGYTAWQVTAQVRLAAAVGCVRVLLTNAAGGISPELSTGHFMLVNDHINLTGVNPLIGRSEKEFIDLCGLYSQHFYSDLMSWLKSDDINLGRGTLAWMPGPTYETPAEINVLKSLGADAVSMSTIPEAIVARLYGLDVVAISLISNMASGLSKASLNHHDVLIAGKRAEVSSVHLVKALFSLWISTAR
jgi:purine-nucleoside phosphorylase